MRKILLTLCILLVHVSPHFAEEIIDIRSDDILLIEPQFSNHIKEKLPFLKEKLLNLEKPLTIHRLNVEFTEFKSFWKTIKNYYRRKKTLTNNLNTLEKDILIIREKIFNTPNLKSVEAIQLILTYKLIKKNILHSHKSDQTLDKDLVTLFQVLKHRNLSSKFEITKDLESYSGVMVNAVNELKSKKIGFDRFEEISNQGIDSIENGTDLRSRFIELGIQISGAFYFARELDKMKTYLLEIWKTIYHYELYIIENQRITLSRLVGTAISLITLIVAYFVFRKIFSKTFSGQGISYAIETLVKYTVIITTVVILLSGLGLDVSRITLLVSALSVGIGFGLTTIVSNFISGVILLVEGSIKVGDKLKLADGQVVDVKVIGLRKSIMRTLDDTDIVIPNTEFVSKEVTNLTHKGQTVTRHRIPFSVNPAVDYKQMEKVVINSAINTLGGDEMIVNHYPAIRVQELSTSKISCELVVYLDYEKNYIPDQVFITNMLKDLMENGLDIFTAPVTPVEMVEGKAAKNPNFNKD